VIIEKKKAWEIVGSQLEGFLDDQAIGQRQGMADERSGGFPRDEFSIEKTQGKGGVEMGGNQDVKGGRRLLGDLNPKELGRLL